MNSKFRNVVRLCLGILAVSLVGCGVRTTTVTGKLTYKGKSAGNCSVTLVASNGVSVSAITDADGGFTMPDVPIGTAKVLLVSLNESTGQKNKAREATATPGASSKPTAPSAEEVTPAPVSAVVIDPKYADPATSPLTAEVKGEQPLTIEVTGM